MLPRMMYLYCLTSILAKEISWIVFGGYLSILLPLFHFTGLFFSVLIDVDMLFHATRQAKCTYMHLHEYTKIRDLKN